MVKWVLLWSDRRYVAVALSSLILFQTSMQCQGTTSPRAQLLGRFAVFKHVAVVTEIGESGLVFFKDQAQWICICLPSTLFELIQTLHDGQKSTDSARTAVWAKDPPLVVWENVFLFLRGLTRWYCQGIRLGAMRIAIQAVWVSREQLIKWVCLKMACAYRYNDIYIHIYNYVHIYTRIYLCVCARARFPTVNLRVKQWLTE